MNLFAKIGSNRTTLNSNHCSRCFPCIEKAPVKKAAAKQQPNRAAPQMAMAASKKQYSLIDDSPFRQTFEIGIFISTAGKSILNLVKW